MARLKVYTEDYTFYIFIKDIDEVTECMLRKFAHNKKPGEEDDTPNVFVAIQKDLDRIWKWADGTVMKVQQREPQSPNPKRGITPCTTIGQKLTSCKEALHRRSWWAMCPFNKKGQFYPVLS